MKSQVLFLLLLIPIPFAFAQAGDQNGIPPTNSFQIITNNTGANVTAQKYNDEVKFVGQSGISIVTDFLTNTIYFAFGSGGGGDCSTVGKWLDSFNYTSYNFDCDTAGGNFTDSTTASNLSPGTGIFDSKVGNDLQFKSLDGGTGITLSNNATTVLITNSLPEDSSAVNIGNGTGVFSSEVGNVLQFKSLTGIGNTEITSNGTDIFINSTGGSGETNTASNVGTGDGWFKQKTGVDLEFKTVIGQDGITSTPNANDITLGLNNIAKSKISSTGTFPWAEISKSGSSIHHLGNVTASGCASGEILKVNSTGYFVCAADDNTGTGENTTVTNIGSGEAGVFKQLNGDEIQLKTLKQGTGITVTNNTDDISITNSLPEASSGSNLGSGTAVFSSEVGNDLQFKSLVAGDNIALSANGTTIMINSTASGSGDSLGNHTATQDLDMNGNDIINATTISTGDITANTAGEIAGNINFTGKNDANADTTYARISTEIADPTAGTESGMVHFQVQDYNGILEDFMKWDDWNEDGVVFPKSFVRIYSDNDNGRTNANFRVEAKNNTEYQRFELVSDDATYLTNLRSYTNTVGNGGMIIQDGDQKLGFHGATPVAQQTVTGDVYGNTALSSFLSDMDTKGLIVDSTSDSGLPTGQVYENNTASNIGSGEAGVFKTKSGVDLQFKTLKAGTGITITNNTDDITIDSTSSGGALDDVWLEGTEVSNSRSNLNFNDTSKIDFNVQDTSGLDAANVTAVIVAGSINDNELGTGIDTTQFGTGGVTSTEFGYIGTLTSDAQTQLNGKQTTTLADGNILVGNSSALANSVNPSGAVDITNTGVFSIPNIHGIANVTEVGCAANQILKVNSTGYFACSADNSGSGGALDDITLEGSLVTDSRANINFNDTSVVDFNVQDSSGTSAGNVTATIVTGSIGDTQLGTGIDTTQFADGSVTSSEFQFINTLTSNAQTQINTKGTLDDVWLEGSEVSNSRSNLNFNDTSVIDFNVQDTSGLDASNVTASIVSGSIGDTQLGTGIDTTQFGGGGVTSSEFDFIGTLTSNAQTQLNTKVDTSANSGTGEGTLLKTVSGTTLTAKTLKQGSGITLTNNADDVTIASTGGSNALLDGSSHTDTVAQTVSRGSLIYGDQTPKWNELVIGASGTVLRSNSTDAAWTALVAGDLPNTIVYNNQANTYSGAGLQNFSNSAIAFNADPADAGDQRHSNAGLICWEASPAGTDVCISVDASEDFLFDSNTNNINLNSNPLTNGVLGGTLDANNNILDNVAQFSSNADEADAGLIRLGNAETIAWEASPAGTDTSITTDASEDLVLSSGFNNVNLGSNPMINTILRASSTGNTVTADPRVAILTAGGATLQAATTPARTTIDATNMDYVVLDFDATTAETAIWNWEVPAGMDATQDVTAKVRFQVASGTAGACFTGSWLGRTAAETVDASFGTTFTGCDSSTGTNQIEEATLTFSSAEHGLAASDSAFFKLTRAVSNATDTNTNDARVIDVRVTWS